MSAPSEPRIVNGVPTRAVLQEILGLRQIKAQQKKEKYPLSLGYRRGPKVPGRERGRPAHSRDQKEQARAAKIAGRPAVKTFPDGRQVINLMCPQGFREYRLRVRLMLERQQGVCCLSRACPQCPGALRLEDAVFEHQLGRGMGGGKRDDRIERDGKWINGACHEQCNRWKSSRWVDYNRP